MSDGCGHGDHGEPGVDSDELVPPPLDGPCDAGAPSAPSQQKSEVSATLLQEGATDFANTSRCTVFPSAKFTTRP